MSELISANKLVYIKYSKMRFIIPFIVIDMKKLVLPCLFRFR